VDFDGLQYTRAPHGPDAGELFSIGDNDRIDRAIDLDIAPRQHRGRQRMPDRETVIGKLRQFQPFDLVAYRPAAIRQPDLVPVLLDLPHCNRLFPSIPITTAQMAEERQDNRASFANAQAPY